MDRIDGKPHRFLTEVEDATRWTKVDLTLGSGPASIVEWTSATTETGSMGNPELATAKKGELAFGHAVEQLADLARWFKDRPDQARGRATSSRSRFRVAVRVLRSTSSFSPLAGSTVFPDQLPLIKQKRCGKGGGFGDAGYGGFEIGLTSSSALAEAGESV